METINPEALVTPAPEIIASFEACAAFGPTGDGSPVCAGCGWLDVDHVRPVAEVHSLRARRVARPAPRRLAS